MDLYAVFFLIAIALLILEVTFGLTLGIALSGAISFLLLGTIELLEIPKILNHYLIAGITVFCLSTAIVLKKFKRATREKKETKYDINDY